MPRDSSGTYSLPAGNPVVTATVISSTWANTTLEDLADAMTDSLSRSGDGGMTAALEITDGTVSLPGLAFGLDPNTGLYRPATDTLSVTAGGTLVAGFTLQGANPQFTVAAGVVGAPSLAFEGDLNTGLYRVGADSIGVSVGGALALTVGGSSITSALTHIFTAVGSSGTTAPLRISNTLPVFMLDETDGGANQRYTRIYNNGAVFFIDLLNDAGDSSNSVFSVTRSGITVGNATWGVTQHLSAAGAVGTPVYSFSGDSNTGLYSISADTLGITCGGTQTLVMTNTACTFRTSVAAADGTLSAPGYNFDNDGDTGLYRTSANVLQVVAGGSTTAGASGVLQISTTAILLATPIMNFSGYTTSGSAGAVSIYLPVTVNGSSYKIPLHAV
jgi:hypothetical protein